ncbi:MAG: DUF1016 family protein [Bacteroidaceae bacterium]|nr:DUF1016 family protein [Bacteroidaceae bacterium]
MRLATEGQVVEKTSDILKDPVVLEFIGLKSDASYSESDLESAIISRLQDYYKAKSTAIWRNSRTFFRLI